MPESMNVGELKEVLERIQELYALAGANYAAADFERLLATLAGHEDQTIDEFVEQTRALLGPAAPRRPKKRLEPSSPLVDEHVRRLLSAGVIQSAFNAALSKLKDDVRVNQAELAAIANRYLNDPTGGTFEFEFHSDDGAYRAIKRMFVERAQDDSKARIIKRMTG
jgi:hypothetical protein